MATSIFTSQTPAIAEADDGTDYTLGTAFRRSNSGSITHGRWFFPTNPPAGTTQFVLYNSSGVELSRASFSSPVGGQWNTVALPSAISYTANDLLVAAIYTSGRYVATTNFFTADLVNGDITAPGDTNGRLGNTDEYPSTVSGNDSCFFADIVFAAGGTSQPIGTTTETDTAFALGRAKARAAGLTSESGAAQPFGRTKMRALGNTTEVDTALAVARVKARALGLTETTEAALPFIPRKTRALGSATEADAAIAFAGGVEAVGAAPRITASTPAQRITDTTSGGRL